MCRILGENDFNSFWDKAVTKQNVEKVKRWEYFPDALYDARYSRPVSSLLLFSFSSLQQIKTTPWFVFVMVVDGFLRL